MHTEQRRAVAQRRRTVRVDGELETFRGVARRISDAVHLDDESPMLVLREFNHPAPSSAGDIRALELKRASKRLFADL